MAEHPGAAAQPRSAWLLSTASRLAAFGRRVHGRLDDFPEPVLYLGSGHDPDTTPPTAPELSLSENEPDGHVRGTTLYYDPTAGGAFTVVLDVDDPESGVASVAFPEVFGGDAATLTSPTEGRRYVHTYRWSRGQPRRAPSR